MNNPLISTESVSKIYSGNGIDTQALNSINLNISDGEFVSIIGKSGSGKTTLLNVLGMLDSPTTGKYYFLGEDVSKLSESRLARIRKGNIGFVFQNINLITELTSYGNIEMPLVYLKVPQKARKKMIDDVLNYFNIGNLSNRFPYQLSGGEQQRIAIARAVVFKPKVILADEPTGNLDPMNSLKIMELLTKLNQDGVTIILITHEKEYADYGAKIVELSNGRILKIEN